MIAGAVGITLDEIAEDQRRLAGEDGVDRIPVGRIEFVPLALLDDGARLAQFCDRSFEYLLLFGLHPRPFCEAHDPKTRSVQRRHALSGVDVKGWKGTAMRIEIARTGNQRERKGDVVDAAGEEADVIERRA